MSTALLIWAKSTFLFDSKNFFSFSIFFSFRKYKGLRYYANSCTKVQMQLTATKLRKYCSSFRKIQKLLQNASCFWIGVTRATHNYLLRPHCANWFREMCRDWVCSNASISGILENWITQKKKTWIMCVYLSFSSISEITF